jgi:hypothetical protein
MTARGSRRLAHGACATVLAALALAVVWAPLPALADGPDDIVVTIPESDGNVTPQPGTATLSNAQLRWGLNAESGGGGFAPGTCNFLSAGLAGDSGGPAVWADGQTAGGVPLYRTQDGSVRVEKPTASGAWTAVSTANRCTDTAGNRVTTGPGSTSGNQVVIDGGTGSIRGGALEIRWTGSFTVVYYSGMTYWSVTDPVLTLDASGNGLLTASASGYGADMNDSTKWEKLDPREVVLAEIRGAATGAAGGFSVTPQYLGVPVDTRGGTPQVSSGSSWGAFPQSFVDFQQYTGQHSYWYSSGGAADAKKPASPVYVSYDAAAPVAVAPPSTIGTGGATAASSTTTSRAAAVTSPAAAMAALPNLPANTPLTTQPQAAGLVPVLGSTLSPLVAPLLGSAAALGLGIISVLSLMQVLPWQRRPL